MNRQELLLLGKPAGKGNLVSICMLLVVALSGLAFFFYTTPKKIPANNSLAWLPPLHKSQELLPIMGTAPDGTPPATIEDIEALVSALRRSHKPKQNLSAAICMQDLDNDWSRSQIRAMRAVFDDYGIRIAAITDAEFNIEKQLHDYRHTSIIAPDLLVTLPIDAAETAAKLRRIAGSGTRLVFIDNIPNGFEHPKDYSTTVMADSYANGYHSLRILAETINGKGKVALLHWNTTMLTCDMRSNAARFAAAKYPGLKTVHVFFDSIADVADITRKLLDEHPELAGIWAVWDAPALEAVKVIRGQERNIYVTTVDLGREAAMELARGDILIGLTAQHPMHQGYVQALCAVAELYGQTPPPLIMVPGQLVTRKRLREAWQHIYAEPLPAEIAAIYDRREVISR